MEAKLVSFPMELLAKIVDLLALQDVKNLSMCNRRYRAKLQDFVFRVVKASWDRLDDFDKEIIAKKARYVHKVIVYNKSGASFGEWNINLLERFADLKQLDILELRLSNGSNCLKFQKHHENNIKTLCLKSSVEDAKFSLYHLRNMTELRQIELCKFEISKDMDEEEQEHQETHKHLAAMKLTNCYWDWPFDFNFYPGLTKLEFYYDLQNPFILGERFKNLLSEHNKLTKLRELVVEIDDSRQKNLYLYPSLNFVNFFHLKNLRRLVLINFKNFDFRHFYEFISEFKQLEYLKLRLVQNIPDSDVHKYQGLLKKKISHVDIEFVY